MENKTYVGNSVVVYPLLILILLPSLLIIMQAMFYSSYSVLPGETDAALMLNTSIPANCHALDASLMPMG